MRRNGCSTCFVCDCISFVSEEQLERCQNDLCAESGRESGDRSAVSPPPHSLHEDTALPFIPRYLLTCSWVLETGLYWVPLLEDQLVNHVRLEDSHPQRVPRFLVPNAWLPIPNSSTVLNAPDYSVTWHAEVTRDPLWQPSCLEAMAHTATPSPLHFETLPGVVLFATHHLTMWSRFFT